MVSALAFLKMEPVFCSACLMAAISAFFVLPSPAYASYINWQVLGILLSLMLIMKCLQKHNLFEWLALSLLRQVQSYRALAGVLILLCFFTSMLITNDVALITFVPFAIHILRLLGRERSLIPIVVMQTIAANLGSMLTPIGNPQNLYLYGVSGVSASTLIGWMMPYSLLSLALILVFVFCQPAEPTGQVTGRVTGLPTGQPTGRVALNREGLGNVFAQRRVWLYLALFLFCLCSVARLAFAPWWLALASVLAVTCLFDADIIPQADYILLATFVAFFIFIGNMEHLEVVGSLLRRLIGHHELLLGTVVSQVVSNVPAALLLSGFTTDYRALLVGVNIGGLGTLIASMASLISYQLYAQTAATDKSGSPMRYLAFFTAANAAFLVVLYSAALVIG